jgi:phosphonate transport system ATP-binding protein
VKDIALKIANVSKTYGKSPVLRSVDFEVRSGSMVALLGTSGAGKSTLFRCLTGLEPIDDGSIIALGEPINHSSGNRLRFIRKKIGYVFQQLHLVKRFSAFENVLGARLTDAPAWRVAIRSFSHEDKLLALECLEKVGMLEFANVPVQLLSGGQQQRVAIARALAQKPKIIIADEPISSLDPVTGLAALQALKTAAAEDDVAVLCSLHQVDLAIEVADRIVGLKEGRISLNVVNDPNDRGIANKIRAIYQTTETTHIDDLAARRHIA